MVLDEYLGNAGVSQGSAFGPSLFLLYSNDLPDGVICNIAIYADDNTLYSKCDQPSDLWATTRVSFWTWSWSTRLLGLEQEMASSIQWWKNSTVSFDQSNSTGAIDMKMDESVLEENYLLRW